MEYQTAKDVWNDQQLTGRQKCRVIWERFLNQEEQATRCPECLKRKLEECECLWPYPSKVGAYSRAQRDADLEGIENLSAFYSRLYEKHMIDGMRLLSLEKKLARMRQKCAARLFSVAKMAGDRGAGTYHDHVVSQEERMDRHNQVNEERKL
jgi:hypothetical protein